MNSNERFDHDLSALLTRLVADLDREVAQKVVKLKEGLVNLQKQNVVKINHSVMELVCAKHLVMKGYEVELEYVLSEILTCDLYSTKGYGNLIVEIETGFIPPDHALDPLTYTSARLASKIIRYSNYAGKFALGVPPHYILPFPSALAKPPRKRTPQEIDFIQTLCDKYYRNPPVTSEEICNARIHEIYIIDVDQTRVQAIDPETYLQLILRKSFIRPSEAT